MLCRLSIMQYTITKWHLTKLLNELSSVSPSKHKIATYDSDKQYHGYSHVYVKCMNTDALIRYVFLN